METFRKFYYKLVTLFCIITTFVFMLDTEASGIGYGCLYIIAGLLCFGAWSIGREQIDPEKFVRTLLLLLAWSMLGFSMMAIGITALLGGGENGLILAFLVIMLLVLVVVYIISIIKNKEIYAIISILLFAVAFTIGCLNTGIFIVELFMFILFIAAFGFFIFSLIKSAISD